MGKAIETLKNKLCKVTREGKNIPSLLGMDIYIPVNAAILILNEIKELEAENKEK